MASQLFNKLWPIDVKFYSGEQPTATKLNGVFNQLSSAMFMLESFLGNGTDYEITEPKDKKMLFNISNAIGSTDKLYKPMNKITSLEYVGRYFGKSIENGVLATYDKIEDILSVDQSTRNATPITIPVNGFAGDEFGIYYTGRGTIENLNGSGDTIDLPNSDSVYSWFKIETSSDTNFIRVRMHTSAGVFQVKSLYLTTKIQDYASGENVAYNKTYALPKDNATYYAVKTPCRYSNPNGQTICPYKTCDYCIGNDYEYASASPYYGMPKCTAQDLGAGLFYVAENGTTSEQRAGYLTMQSPMITVSKPYMIKFAPVSVNDEQIDVKIPQNECIIYDAGNPASPIKYTTSLFSAGRSDIMYVKDIDIFLGGLSSTKRYIILGSYGIIDLIYDILPSIGLALPLNSMPVDVAVYADDSGN